VASHKQDAVIYACLLINLCQRLFIAQHSVWSANSSTQH